MESPFVTDIIAKPSLGDCTDYYATLPAVRGIFAQRRLPIDRAVTFFVGENGTGKSTLLEAVAVAAGFNAEGGSKFMTFATRETHAGLHKHLGVGRRFRRERDGYFLRAESFYNVASYIDENDEQSVGMPMAPLTDSYGGRSLHEQSHGESFMALIENRFGCDSLFVLDEPEAALSPSRQMALIVAMDELVKAGCQFIIATHSPILMTFPGAVIYELSETGIHETDYSSTEHYRITRQFLNAPERMLHILLGDDQ